MQQPDDSRQNEIRHVIFSRTTGTCRVRAPDPFSLGGSGMRWHRLAHGQLRPALRTPDEPLYAVARFGACGALASISGRKIKIPDPCLALRSESIRRLP